MPRYIDFDELPPLSLKDYADNLAKLHKVLEAVPDEQHDQTGWAWYDEEAGHACGTTGCALGWAAMSGQIKGLSYGVRSNEGTYAKNLREAKQFLKLDGNSIDPIYNGYVADWSETGVYLFGQQALDNVFYSDGNKAETLQRIEDQIAVYRNTVIADSED